MVRYHLGSATNDGRLSGGIMITISPTSEMPHDLWVWLGRDNEVYLNLRTFKYYGVVCTTGSTFSDDVIGHCNYIADMLKCSEYRVLPIDPGTWQPGAMRYLIYLIK